MLGVRGGTGHVLLFAQWGSSWDLGGSVYPTESKEPRVADFGTF